MFAGNEFQQTIVGLSRKIDTRTAAPFGEIANREKEGCIEGKPFLSVDGNLQGLRPVADERNGGGQQVRADATHGKMVVLPDKGGVPCNGCGNEEGAAVDRADIHIVKDSVCNLPDAFDGGQRLVEMPSNAVAASERNDPHWNIGSDQASADGRNGSIAAGNEDAVSPVGQGMVEHCPAGFRRIWKVPSDIIAQRAPKLIDGLLDDTQVRGPEAGSPVVEDSDFSILHERERPENKRKTGASLSGLPPVDRILAR